MRCIFGFESRSGAVRTYEERVTLWRATSDDEAIGLAEESAVVYAAECSASYLGLEQSYRLVADTAHGTEVFSLMRDSDLLSDEYLDRFFDTGTERQRIR